jgi:thioredoxin-related protein
MKKIALVILLSLFAVGARGDDLKTNDGKTYAEYTVVSHDDNGISIWYKQGQATIPFDNLPADIQKQYDYKPKEIEWKTDYAASLDEAKKEKKLVLLDFTGSDWCGYCQLLDKEVFTTPAFRSFARENFVCVTIDFPRTKTLPAETKSQNDTLHNKYSVNSFPSLIIVDPNGKELARFTGYNPGSGPEHIIVALEERMPASTANSPTK